MYQNGTVFEHWKIGKKLGSGSGGKTAVFELIRSDSFREVSALKVISLIEEKGRFEDRPRHLQEEYQTALEACKARAIPELRMMLSLRGNTNVVDYLDHKFQSWSNETGFGCDLLIRMEILVDLRSVIKSGRQFSEQEILLVGRDICSALVLCHDNGILHRDIKPENIFINNKGDYKLGDFGVSRLLSAAPNAVATTGIGTPEYAAPEQFHGAHDKRVDIYSLGLVLYELSNRNRLPFASSGYAQPEDIQKRQMGISLPKPENASDALWRVIKKACAHKPEDRYATAREFLAALNRLDGRGAPAVSAKQQNYQTVKADTPEGSYGTRPANEHTGNGKKYATRPGNFTDTGNYGTRPANQDHVQENGGETNHSGKSYTPPKRKNTGIVIAVLMAVLLLGGAGLFLMKNWTEKDGPEKTESPAATEQRLSETDTTITTERKPAETMPDVPETKPEPVLISYETYQSLNEAERQSYMDSFANTADFFAWYESAKAEYDAAQKLLETQPPETEQIQPPVESVFLNDLEPIRIKDTLYYHERAGSRVYTKTKINDPESVYGLWDVYYNRFTYGLHVDGDGSNNFYVEYLLDGSFTTFTGWCIVPSYYAQNGCGKSFSIYCDGKLVETTPKMYEDSESYYFEIDVTGVQVLRIEYPAGKGPNNSAILADGMLYPAQ